MVACCILCFRKEVRKSKGQNLAKERKSKMNTVKELKKKVLEGKLITKEEALTLVDVPLEELSQVANEIREYFCGNKFDICTIINGKSGKCSENCKYCAQSAFFNTAVEEYELLEEEILVRQAKYNKERGVLRYSIVTSGKKLNEQEVDNLCKSIPAIRQETGIHVCASLGLLDENAFRKLKKAGISRVHNNLETSRNNFPNVCTTHTFDEKVKSIKAAIGAGLDVCSGGIMGLGETMEDRIDMVLEIRDLGVRSVPINMLNPIKGTPYEKNQMLNNEEMCRIVAIVRFLVPDASVRLAGGRGLLPDKGRQCFLSGANAAISGDMLTTGGITIEMDMKMLRELGYQIALQE